MSGTVLITVLVLAEFNFNLSEMLGAAADNTGKGEALPRARPEVRRHDHQQDRLPVASAWRWCSAPPVCRTS